MAKSIFTELCHVSKWDVGVKIIQKVVDGPNAFLDRGLSLIIPTPKAAVEFALQILERFVPAVVLRNYIDRIQALATLASDMSAQNGGHVNE